LQGADPTDHDREESLDEETDAEIGKKREHRHYQRAGEAGEGRAEGESEGIEGVGRDAGRPGERRVLERRADAQPKGGPGEQQVAGEHHRCGDGDDGEPPTREVRAADGERADDRLRHIYIETANEAADAFANDQAERVRCEHGGDGDRIEAPDNKAFDNEADRRHHERCGPQPPELIAGTLAYMAPEQTGRMNRSIDSRGDLYSVGDTLYQMLTGILPFTASDPMEWVHCHIARRPAPPSEWLENVPAPVSAIVMKLLAKTAEERYQTAAGLERDLRRCLAGWEKRCRIDEFPLGERDTPDRLLIPEKLYGRASEIETLLASFERVVANGSPELVLVSGYSGIGKSSVVNELQKLLVAPRGLFASGKFEQYKHDIPYATLAQAFASLLRPLLSKSEAELGIWRDALRDALGPNGLLIADLVPELKYIIGEQPPVPALPPQDAQRRFQLVFWRFISVFARPEHPLALFLDDLQWLDAATLDLLEDLLTQPDVRHLMLIGAYRDNEVDPAHPLMRKLEAIRQAGATVHAIVLSSLARDDLERLIADSLHCEAARAKPLAELVHEKTDGNPFFAIQFLSSLAEEGLLTFDHANGRWSWDLNRIHAKGYTDNVVDLMVGKLNRLPLGTQRALQQLACMGNSADFELLATVYQDSNQDIHADLQEAVRAGLVLHTEHAYRFLHDRVQEAAYSLIPEGARDAAHLRIGRLLASRTVPAEIEEKIFEIVNQLNRGSSLITSVEERARVAELNLLAGRRAKTSTAYASALSHLVAGRALLTEQSWDNKYELIFAIEYLMAECEFLTAQMEAAGNRLAMLAQRARTQHDVAVIAGLRLRVYTALDRSDRGVEVFLEFLRSRGTDWSPHPNIDEVRREYDRIWSQIGSQQIEDLIDLPLMTDRDVLDLLDVLVEVMTPALFSDENLSSLVICRIVNLSLEHGNTDGSCFAYVWLAIIAGPRFGNYQDGFRFGQLGYDVVEKRGLKRFQARTYMSFGDIVLPWTRHVRAGRDLVRRAFDAANEIGDLTYAGFCCDHLVKNLLAAGDQLVMAQREAEDGLRFAQRVRFGLVVDHLKAQLGLIRSLRGLTSKFGSFDDDQFDELRFERYLKSNRALAELECWYWVRKLQARFLAGDYAAAVHAALSAQRQLWTSPSQFEAAELSFFGALSHAASWDSAPPDKKQDHFDALTVHHRQLVVWAEHCPENFENRSALVGAEIARIQGRALEAERLYEQAIRSARANGFVHNEALAYELAARFYMARDFEKIAHMYLRDARDCYLQWGADGKVRQLDKLYPLLRHEQPLPDPTSTIQTSVEHLDLGTVIKLSQAISGEIVREKLIDSLMRTAIEHAGAERGLLILARGDEYRIVAEATTGRDTVAIGPRQASVTAADLPLSVLHYVARTKESVLLHDASDKKQFSADDYIARHHARSILCLPLLKEAGLVGVLYLENNLVINVFTPDRIVVLKLLASEAAISLENIRLYDDLQDREAKIRRLVDSNIIGIFIWHADGRIIDANEAYLRIIGYHRSDLIAGRLSWRDLTPPEWRGADDYRVAQLEMTGTAQPYEKEYFRKDGGRVPVLVGAATFEGRSDEGVGFVLDLTDRKSAERAYTQVQTELAHANRVATMGHLTASIAHEINQPIGAAITYANAALNWLGRESPNLEEVRRALGLIVEAGIRAGAVIDRIRALVKKAPARRDRVEINEAVLEIVELTRREMVENAISVQMELAEGLLAVQGDRVQLQQVMLNLLINAIEAMSGMSEGSRELLISTQKTESEGVLVAVRDSGPGLAPDSADRLFESFYTTKSGGLGMGLSISRSIIEAHQGRLWASANTPRGAVFQFTLPTYSEQGGA
jgi:PAS domain S-box-containing protein